jgi:hypothetical protein
VNILQTEDLVKGLPDQRLMQEAQAPSGDIPQFLLISEVQRRADMRKRFEQQNAEQPEGTIADQVLQQGIGSQQEQVPQTPPPNMPYPLPTGQGIAPNPNQPPPPQPPNAQIAPPQGGMAAGGLVRMFGGGSIDFPYNGQVYKVGTAGYRSDEEAIDAFLQGGNQPLSVSEGTGGFDTDVQLMPDAVARGQAAAGMEETVTTGRMPTETGSTVVRGVTPSMGQAQPSSPVASENVGIEALGYRADPNMPPQTARTTAMSGQPAAPDLSGIEAQNLPGEERLGIAGALRDGFNEVVFDPLFKAGDYMKNTTGGEAWDSVSGTIKDAYTEWAEDPEAKARNEALWTDVAGPENLPFAGQSQGLNDATAPGEGTAGAASKLLAETKGVVDPTKVDDTVDQSGVGTTDGKSKNYYEPPTGVMSVAPPAAAAAADPSTPRDLLMGIGSQKSPPVPEIKDLIAQQRKAAWSNALMQLGAGIAGGNISEGLSKAGNVMSVGAAKAREMDMQSRLAQYSADRKDVDRQADVYSKVGQLDIAAARVKADKAIQDGRDRNEILRFTQNYVNLVMANDFMSVGKDREEKIRRILQSMMPPDMLQEFGPALGVGQTQEDTSGWSMVK